MTGTQKFHASDIKLALNARDHEVRAWLALEPLSLRKKMRRSATDYTPLDLLFLAVIQQLHQAGFSPKAMQAFSGSLYKSLAHPVPSAEADELVLHQGRSGALVTGNAPPGTFCMEIRIPLRSARMRVLEYTGAPMIAGQGELNLLASIRQPASRSDLVSPMRKGSSR